MANERNSENAMTDAVHEVPVLIVGAGPAGLAATLLLKQYGIEALTVNRYGWTANTPRAHYQNQRAIEILRELKLEDEVMATGMAPDLARNVVWTETLAGVEFARIQTCMAERQDDYRRASPCESSNIAQCLLEPIMARAALERGASIRWQHEFVDLVQDENGVTATIEDRVDGRRYEVRAKYVIGADGARSRVAQTLGVQHEGQEGWAAAVNVWFKADLTKYCAYRPGILYWTNRPGLDFWVGSGGFINVRPWNEWVMSFMYDPAQGMPDLAPEALVERVRTLVGDPALDVEVLAASPWQMNALVADRMCVGRVFLAGDAVHRHPPSGGLGSNTSMQDAYNLAWKLAAVLKGEAGAALLDSYETERLPVARKVVARSMQNIDYFVEVAKALGFRPGQTADEGWRAWEGLAAPTGEGAQRREALSAALALQRYHFAAHGTELGTRYLAGALVAAQTDEDGERDAGVESSGIDGELHYVPRARAGSHLPHAWIERQADRRRMSTLDACGSGRFTLLVGHAGAGWRAAAASVSAATGLTLDVVEIGTGLEYRDVENAWHALSETGDDGCLLVRPDKVVAWHSAGLASDPARELERVVRAVLAR
jgi:2,4-dichlorophenol 6-monooxygenase